MSVQSKAGKELTPTIGDDSSGQPGDVALCSLANMGAQPPSTVLLGTARILVRDSHGNEQGVRALLDSGAQDSFITQRCCQRLGLSINRGPSCPVVKGIGGTCKTTKGYINLTFYSRLDRNINFNLKALVVDKVTERLPAVSVDTSAMIAFENLTLADDNYAVPGDIDMLIGASLFPHLLLHNKVKGSSSQTAPYALETVLGYVIVGSAPTVDNVSATYCCCTVAVKPPELLTRNFREIEEGNIPYSSGNKLGEGPRGKKLEFVSKPVVVSSQPKGKPSRDSPKARFTDTANKAQINEIKSPRNPSGDVFSTRASQPGTRIDLVSGTARGADRGQGRGAWRRRAAAIENVPHWRLRNRPVEANLAWRQEVRLREQQAISGVVPKRSPHSFTDY